MKKAILFFVVFALAVMNLTALDITTTKGVVYRNVEITNVLPNAIGFMYIKKDGTSVLRDVKLNLLTKDLQKKFKYSPKKAKKFEKHVAKFQADRARQLKKHHQEDLAQYNKHEKMSKELDQIKAALYTHRITCWVHIIRVIGQDCIGYIAKPYSSTKFGQLGKLYIRNLAGSQNARIGTVIYPTGATKSFQDGVFTVYDASLTKCALRILAKREKAAAANAPAPIIKKK